MNGVLIVGTIVPIVRTTEARALVDPAIVLFGRTRRRVLGWLLGHAHETFYLREIARQIDTPVGAVQRELEQLTSAGLVTRSVHGRHVYFQTNREAPIFPELQSILAKTSGCGYRDLRGLSKEAEHDGL